MKQSYARFDGRLRGRTVIAGLLAIVWLGPLGGCTFDPKLSELAFVDVPVVICDRRASSCSTEARNELAWIAYFGDIETIDGSRGAPVTSGQPIAGGAGCQFEGALSMPAIFSSGQLFALDEDDWVTECAPGSALFSWDPEQGQTVILGTAVFTRDEPGCVIRTENFCSL